MTNRERNEFAAWRAARELRGSRLAKPAPPRPSALLSTLFVVVYTAAAAVIVLYLTGVWRLPV